MHVTNEAPWGTEDTPSRGAAGQSRWSLGRSGVTAPCGTPQGQHLSSWWRSQLLRLMASALPRSPSSQPARWKTGGRRS